MQGRVISVAVVDESSVRSRGALDVVAHIVTMGTVGQQQDGDAEDSSKENERHYRLGKMA